MAASATPRYFVGANRQPEHNGDIRLRPTAKAAMSETSLSLLQRLRREPDPASWQRLVDLYTPLLRDWLRRAALQPQDADDLIQEVFAVLVNEIPQFDYNPERGSFRGWLRTILANRLRGFYRARQNRPVVAGGSGFAHVAAQLEDPHSELSQLWNREHDQHVCRRLLELIKPDFEATTWDAFQRVTVDGVKPAQAAKDLGISVNAVFIAKSRVMRRLRQEMQGLSEI
jgi:RNA polymerase sigma factor (sigma-70 family)